MMIKSGYLELGCILAFASPFPVGVSFHFFGVGGAGVAVWLCCVVCMICIAKSLEHRVAYEVHQANQEAENLRLLLSAEREASSFEKQALIEQCQNYDFILEENTRLKEETQRLTERCQKLEERLEHLREIAFDDELGLITTEDIDFSEGFGVASPEDAEDDPS